MTEEDKKRENRLCFRCKQNIAGKPENISFIYNGLKVTVFKDGMTCTECEKQRWIEDFERNGRELINLEDKKIIVDWSLYSEAYRKDSTDKMTSILISLGIFSLYARECWNIVGTGEISLNPRYRVICLYFTRREDAVSFAFLNHADTTYAWEIRYISRILGKEKVLRQAKGKHRRA